MISRYAVDARIDGKEEEVSLYAFKLGKQVGTLDTGSRAFEPIFRAALKQPPDRFFGPGRTYILKSSSGVFYVVFFEYQPGNERFSGSRFGIGRLSDLGSEAVVFVGFPYDGRGMDAPLLKQLKTITERLIEAEGKQ